MAWTDLLAVLTVSELAARLQNYWTAIGVVSALVATMAQTALLQMPAADDSYSADVASTLTQVYFVLCAIALTACVATCLCSTIFYAQVNQVPSPETLLTFICQFQGVFGLPTLCFQCGCLSLTVATCVWVFLVYGWDQLGPYLATTSFLACPIMLFRIFNAMQAMSVSLQVTVKRERSFSLDELSVNDNLPVDSQRSLDESLL